MPSAGAVSTRRKEVPNGRQQHSQQEHCAGAQPEGHPGRGQVSREGQNADRRRYEPHPRLALKAVLQAEVDANQAIDTTRAQVQQQVAESRTARTKARATRNGSGLASWATTGPKPSRYCDLLCNGCAEVDGAKKTAETKAQSRRQGTSHFLQGAPKPRLNSENCGCRKRHRRVRRPDVAGAAGGRACAEGKHVQSK